MLEAVSEIKEKLPVSDADAHVGVVEAGTPTASVVAHSGTGGVEDACCRCVDGGADFVGNATTGTIKDRGHRASGAQQLAVRLGAVAPVRGDALTAALTERLPDPRFVIEPQLAAKLCADYSLSTQELLTALVPVAKAFSRPEISNYQVGAAALGASGRIYLGVNLEFAGFPLSESVHGEQSTIANAMSQGETALEQIAVSAAPCGHCRQFLNEAAPGITVLTPDNPPEQLGNLLPKNFGPGDLGIEADPLNAPSNGLHLAGSTDDVAEAALAAANRSWSPYASSPSGVAVRLRDGRVFSGAYIENAAFNPSLSPIQAAIVCVVAAGGDPADITEAVLVETLDAMAGQEDSTRRLIEYVAPGAAFTVRNVKKH